MRIVILIEGVLKMTKKLNRDVNVKSEVRTFRLYPNTIKELDRRHTKTRLSKTAILELALQEYFANHPLKD